MTNFFTHKFRKRSPIQIVGIIIFGVIAITGLAILFGFIVMWLWNWLMPEVFGLTTLTYWQAVGMFILLKILLGGIGVAVAAAIKNHRNTNMMVVEKSLKQIFLGGSITINSGKKKATPILNNMLRKKKV